MFNTNHNTILSFLSSDTLESMDRELNYYLPEIVAEGKEKEFCAMLMEIRIELSDENRKECK